MDLPAASKFGQKLAHTDKHVRDKTVKSLTQYLVKKKEWSDLDLDKIWKALFYCMWMSDKPKIQNELADNLSQLMHAFPSSTLKTRFIHSFFKTIHREWHGIDGLRLDKYYSLIRKMLFQSFKFLQSEWEHAQDFASHLSSEVLSKLPNGLRLHLCDVYIQELHKSIGATVESENLIMLLEPFFTLISTETDRIVTKRVNDLVFQVLLTDYQFQDTLKEKEPVATTDSEDNEDDADAADEAKVFGVAHLAAIQHRIFDLAAAEDTHDRNRNILYSIYSALYAATKVDSAKNGLKRPAGSADDVDATAASKKKKRRKSKGSSEDAADAADDEPVASKVAAVKEEASPKKSPKKEESKKQTKEVESPKKSPKKEVESVKKESVSPKKEDSAAKKASKKDAKHSVKDDQEDVKAEEADVAPKKAGKAKAKAPASQKEQPTPYPRCTSCGGFGKGLVPVNKSMCGHCDRKTKQDAKAKAATDKKRKASAVADASAEAAAAAEASKKVRFGTNKALPYELSMKRMKKSVEKELVKPATGKGVLKVKEIVATATSNVKKNTTLNVKRARAADFF